MTPICIVQRVCCATLISDWPRSIRWGDCFIQPAPPYVPIYQSDLNNVKFTYSVQISELGMTPPLHFGGKIPKNLVSSGGSS